MDFCLEYEFLNDENHVFKSISYEELIDLLDGFGSGLFYIGGAWCKNCQAIIKDLNDIAKKLGLDVVYNYDSKFINVFKEEEDLRDCKTLENKLKYYAIVEKIKFKSEELVVDTLIPRIHVPFIFAMKNGSCVGYYSEELIKDELGLHKEGSNEDKTIDFTLAISDLINKVNKDRF